MKQTKAKAKVKSKTKAKPAKADKKKPAKVRKKKKRVKLSYLDMAQVVADIADREAITCSGVKSFPDLLDGTGIKAEDITPGIVHAANEINRRAMQEILDRVEKLNDSLVPKSEFFEKGPGNVPSGDTYTGEILSFTFPQKRRNKVAATMLKVTKDDAVQLLVELGLKGAEGYPTKKLEKRLRALPTTVEQTGQKPKTAEAKALLAEITDLAKEGGKLTVTESGPSKLKGKSNKKAAKASANGKAKSKSKTKKAADDDDDDDEDEDEAPKVKKGKKAKAEKSEKTKKAKSKSKESGTDKYGSRLGTNNAKINEALSRKWQTMQEIMEGAGLKGTCYDHLNRMIDKGFVEKGGKDDRQYKLTR